MSLFGLVLIFCCHWCLTFGPLCQVSQARVVVPAWPLAESGVARVRRGVSVVFLVGFLVFSGVRWRGRGMRRRFAGLDAGGRCWLGGWEGGVKSEEERSWGRLKSEEGRWKRGVVGGGVIVVVVIAVVVELWGWRNIDGGSNVVN